MKKIRPALALILSIILLCLCACGKTDGVDSTSSAPTPSTEPEISGELQLLYCSNDTLNPYNTINKTNAEIGKLLFDPLVTLSNEFEPVNILAQSVTVEGTKCTVKLRDAAFSDGTAVTAADVLNSYSLAKESELYSYLFYEVVSVTAADGSTVVFELSRHDPYFASLLTFPILKKGTENLKNEDNVEIAPTGSGRFVFSDEEEALIPNPHYFGDSGSISRITLVDAPDSESVEHYVEIGATDLYYTDPVNGSIIRMSGSKAMLNINNLVYIGINHDYAPLADVQLRYAISSAIDRARITDEAFYSNAVAANGFFHPVWNSTAGYQTLQINAQTKLSIENLEKIGYNSLDKEGFRVDQHGNVLELTLLVNNSNPTRMAAARLIEEQLAAAGIKLTINAVSNEQYFEALSNGNFQLYLGEIKLTPNMDTGALVLSGGSAAYGIKAPEEGTSSPENGEGSSNPENADPEAVAPQTVINCTTVLKGYYAGENSISDVATSLITDMPVIPVVYRSALLFYSSNISDVGSASAADIFQNLKTSQ